MIDEGLISHMEDLAKDATVSGVHVETAIGNDSKVPPKKKPAKKPLIETPPKKPPVETEPFEITVDVDKASVNDDQQIVYGWASVTHEGGGEITDLQGDCIEIAEIAKAAHDFMSASRVAGDSHQFLGVGQVVESVVFTPELQKALDIDLGKAGWFIGMKIHDINVWKRVRSGELRAFSIGGSGNREEI